MEQGPIRLTSTLSAPQTPVSTINAPQAWASHAAAKHVEKALLASRGTVVILLGQLFDWAAKSKLWACVVRAARIGPHTGVMSSQSDPVAKIPPQH